jgi:hypothetical protein
VSIPLPRDPRTPLQAAQARLDAALRTTYLPRGERQELADRITQLRADVDGLTPVAA